MCKIKHSNKNITPFGGLNFIYNALNTANIPQYIDNKVGYRSVFAQYSYSDIVLSLFGNALCQGSFVSDLEIFKQKFSSPFFSKIPSPDTVEYACQELKTENIVLKTENNIEHQLNYNQSLNHTLVALCVKTNQLKSNEGYTLDFDNVVIENQKQDAKTSYKNTKAYHPNISFIGRLPVHIENRNGNTPASFEQMESLTRCFENLKKNEIGIKNFRADSASCQQNVFEMLENEVDFFFIRAKRFASFKAKCAEIDDWKTVEIGYENKEVSSINFAYGKDKKEYRVVVTRTKRKVYVDDLFPEIIYSYQGIVTNSHLMSEKEVIEFYNQRGDSEKSNCYLLNDFNFNHLPFMDMNTNTVYMYFMALSSVLFEWTKHVLVKNKTAGIKLNIRVKSLCFRYIMVAASWLTHARQKIITVFSTDNYSILQI